MPILISSINEKKLFNNDFNQKQTDILKNLLTERFKNSCSFDKKTIEDIKVAILNGAEPSIHDQGTFKNTALIWAILYDEKELASFLIDHDTSGVSLNEPGKYLPDNTPLILAIKKGLFDVALKLIEKGADVNKGILTDNLSPLHLAILILGTPMGGKKEENKSLLFSGGVTEKEKIYKEKLLILELINQNADLNATDRFGKTPLDYLNEPFYKTSLYLCNKGLDLNDPQIKNKKDAFNQFIEARTEIYDNDDLSNEEIHQKVKELETNTVPDVVNYAHSLETIKTARELIEDPYNKFNSIEDIEQSRQYNIIPDSKGGNKDITHLLTYHLHFHQNVPEIIESRSKYLKTHEHQEFCFAVFTAIDALHIKLEY